MRRYVINLVCIIGFCFLLTWCFYAEDDYLGEYSSNPYDSDSVSNPYGQYGSEFSPDSINNPFGQYGSPYSPNSATNPFAIEPPKIYAPKNDFNSYGTGGSDLFNLLDNE